MASPKCVCALPVCISFHTPCTVTGSLLMYFKLTEASETNRLATEFLKLWSFISLSMKCESVFLTKKKRKRKSDCKCICEANYQPCVELL